MYLHVFELVLIFPIACFKSLLTQLLLLEVHAVFNRIDAACVPDTTASEAIQQERKNTQNLR